MSDSYYDVIGIEPTATREEIRTAYRARVDELKASREGKTVSEAALQQNRDEVAELNAAWNVLSDPYQRGRYDQQLLDVAAANGNGEVELVDDEVGSERPPLTGWRKILAPPPPKSRSGGRAAPPPTQTVPGGHRLAEPRSRFRSLTFDFLVVALILYGAQAIVPGLVKSDYQQIDDRASTLADRAERLDRRADRADDRAADASTDLRRAQRQDDTTTADAAREERNTQRAEARTLREQADAATDRSRDVRGKLRGANFAWMAATVLLSLLYLVPLIAARGQSIGHRIARVRVVGIDGSPATAKQALLRSVMPLALAVLLFPIGGALALFLVMSGTGKGLRQGMHDKLARTLVVEA